MTIKRFLIIPIMFFVWVLSLAYNSGIGIVYDIYGKVEILTLFIALGYYLFTWSFWSIKSKYIFFIAYALWVSLYTGMLHGHSTRHYLWLYILIPLIGSLPIHKFEMKLVSFMYGALGLFILVVYNYTNILSGWNENSIAMVALFSFAVMLAAFNRIQNVLVGIGVLLYMSAYYVLSGVLNSRSGVLFAIIMLLGVYGIIPIRKLLYKKRVLTIILSLPLVVAILIVAIHNESLVLELNEWSYETFNKPIFNGRDDLWEYGFKTWFKNPIFGTGNLGMDNWHNSAVTMLVGGGLVGYLLWIGATANIMNRARKFLDDNIVLGLMIGFLGIWLQQTVELGLVAPQANAIPFAILGVLVGRAKTLQSSIDEQAEEEARKKRHEEKKRKKKEEKEHKSHILHK